MPKENGQRYDIKAVIDLFPVVKVRKSDTCNQDYPLGPRKKNNSMLAETTTDLLTSVSDLHIYKSQEVRTFLTTKNF